ncbi:MULTISPECIES: ankyrin repeat domain-containing protein [unclassified Clostridium]|uniref:ankyrin repeat domain-containing protein n=1 Tax=unclassified Clostridium TaxID=2614128 RepID=UPI001C8BDFE8|nr:MULTISPECIES: ankyrin repeat domain-containing protein [unclassified Clostridium]MBX9136165.1 ankyrin repeat domain-containing protein [Clostridium sp. K12(2020)]MBX9143203.1 ankyrin repeat domain-containing protein [Clostridium sp. K13]
MKTSDIIKATQNNDYKVVEGLIKVSNIDYRDKDGKTALFYAVLEHNIDLCSLLIEEGANLYIKDDRNLMAIHYAALCNNNDIINLFYEHDFKYSLDKIKNEIIDIEIKDKRIFLKFLKKLF